MKLHSDPEIDSEIWERLKNNLKEIDPSRNYSQKHYLELSIVLADHLLEKKMREYETSISQIKRELDDIQEVID